MDFKLVLFSVACFGLSIQPAQSGSIGFAVLDTIRDIASIGTNVFKTKVGAVVRGGTDMGSIISTGIGLNIGALAKASGTIGNAAANGFIAAGKRIDKLGDQIVGDMVSSSLSSKSGSGGTRIVVTAPVVQEVIEKVKVDTPNVVEQEVAVPCGEEEVVVVPSETISSAQLRVREPATVVETARIPVLVNRPSVWSMLEKAAFARSRANEVSEVVSLGGVREGPLVYEVINTPQFGALQLRKK